MKHRIVVGASFAAALLVSVALAEGGVKSGPQPGDDVPGPFHVLNCNGSDAGKTNCQV